MLPFRYSLSLFVFLPIIKWKLLIGMNVCTELVPREIEKAIHLYLGFSINRVILASNFQRWKVSLYIYELGSIFGAVFRPEFVSGVCF